MGVSKGYQPNIFRAVSGSLFSTPVNWSRGYVPTGSDVADIRDNCIIDISRTIGSLVVKPGVTASINTGLTLRINDTINVLGHLSCSGTPNIFSFARKNVINSLSPGNSIFTYTGSNQQSLPGVTYFGLNVYGNSRKIVTSNLITSGTINIDGFSILDLDRYDLIAKSGVNIGSVSIGEGTLRKSQTGSIYIEGLLFIDTHTIPGLDFSGNPTIETKNGLTSFDSGIVRPNTGRGTWIFSANQSLTASLSIQSITNPILVSGSTNLIISRNGGGYFIFSDTINGTSGSSKLTNQGGMYFSNASNIRIMNSGSFDITSSINTIGYQFSDNVTLPYSNYSSLILLGSGTKTISGSTIISGSLTFPNSGNAVILELSSSDFVVSGSTSIGGSGILNSATISRIHPQGRTIFIGSLTVDNAGGSATTTSIDFSRSNADIEFRNGFAIYTLGKMKTGTGSLYFTTNNQTIATNTSTETIDARLIVSGNIAVTVSSNTAIIANNEINGTNSNSRFINRGTIFFATSASLNTSLTTGSFDFSSSINTVVVGGNYDGTIPARFSSSFYNLTINGTGVKTLATSSVILNSLINNTNGTFELGNHDLFVSGTTIVGDGATNIFRKSGPGNITFGGEIARLGWNSGVGTFDLSGGNPNVEVRRGIRTLGANTSTFKSGFGTWSFAVNNQRIYLDNFAVPSSLTFSGSVLIKDGITLTIDPYGANGGFPGLGGGMAVVIMKDINGTTPSAKLMVSGALYFASSSRSMTIGTIDNTSIGNIIGYISSEPSQSLVYSSNYFNLYIANSGVKYATSSLYMSGGLTITNGGNLDVGTYDMFVSGTTTLQTGSLIKTSSGNITFNGQINTLGFSSILLNTSESKIELRNGINLDFSPIVPNTHTFYFTTNNQIITSSNAATSPSLNNTNFIISGAINLTISPAFQLFFNGYMDGTDLSSKLTIGRGPVPLSPGGGVVYYSSPIMPMATSGTLDASSSLNVFVYNGAAQDIKGGIYRNLTFQGGTKTLRGNVSVLNTLSTGSTVVNLNGFTLTNP